VRRAPRGRPRRYCSNACRQKAHRRRRDGQQKRRLVRLVEADAREFLRTVPDESVDLIVTDPPYHFERGGTYFREWFAELADEEWPAIFAELYRVLRRDAHAYVFCDPRTLPIFNAAAEAAGFRVRTPLVWDKCSIALGSCWRARYEHIAWYEKGCRTGNYNNRSNVLAAPRVARGYPTEKPVALLRELIAQASAPGELVLDPFCGSGNVGRAGRELRRKVLLCDVRPDVAAKRLRIAIAGFEPRAE
jgi:site-specific DNA-methyltransferase (adenine-specific)